jgi:methionyl-tRNA synthetase
MHSYAIVGMDKHFERDAIYVKVHEAALSVDSIKNHVSRMVKMITKDCKGKKCRGKKSATRAPREAGGEEKRILLGGWSEKRVALGVVARTLRSGT